jgi:membrane protein
VINRAYDIEEGRPWWKVRMLAIGLTIGLAVFIVVSFGLIVAGPQLADWLAARFGFGEVFVWTWKVIQWPVAFALVVTGIGLIYYYAPDAQQDWVWITPGSLLAAVLWLIGSLGFRFYVVNWGNYEATYGAIAGVILLMLWFYLSGLVLIVGAETSAEIEHASPWGKAPGEKGPGEKRKLGPAAARWWRERGHAAVATPTASTTPTPASLPVTLPQPSLLDRVGAYVVLFLRWRHKVRQ